jgi:hypothetical protein
VKHLVLVIIAKSATYSVQPWNFPSTSPHQSALVLLQPVLSTRSLHISLLIQLYYYREIVVKQSVKENFSKDEILKKNQK